MADRAFRPALPLACVLSSSVLAGIFICPVVKDISKTIGNRVRLFIVRRVYSTELGVSCVQTVRDVLDQHDISCLRSQN